MSHEKALTQNTILYSISNFGSSALTFLMLPIYTRYFSPEAFGMWDITITTVTLLIPFVTLELTAAMYRWLIVEEQYYEQRKVISTGFIQIIRQLALVNSAAVLIFLYYSFPYQWEALFFLDTLVMSGFMLQCARGLKRNVLFATLGLLQSIIVVGSNLIFIFIFKLGIEAFYYANIIAGIVVIFIAWLKLNFHHYVLGEKAFSKTLLRDYFSYAIPIMPAAASWWVMTMSDRWMIAYYLGVSANGIYAIALKIPAVLLMINTVFSLAWKDSAIATFHTAEKDAFYSRIFRNYFRILAISVIILTLLAKPLIGYFIGAAYFEAWKYSGILLLATLFHALALFWSAGFHGAKQTKAILTSSIIGALVNVLLNLFFIHIFGLYAVSFSTLIAFFVTWVLRVRDARDYFKVTINYAEFTLWMIGMIGVGGIIFWT